MADEQGTAVAPEIERAIIVARERIRDTEFVLSFIEKSSAKRADHLSVCDEILDNYLVTHNSKAAYPKIGSVQYATANALRTKSTNQKEFSKLKSPDTNQMVDSFSAQGIGLLMPQLDYIQVIGIGMDDVEKSRLLQRLLQGILQAPGNYRTNFMTFKDGFLFGTAIQEIGWSTKSRLQVVNNPTFNKDGFLIGQEQSVDEVVYYDAPLIRNVDIYDFYPDPSGTRIQEDMIGIAKRFRISKAQALRLGNAGVYDKNQVKEAVRSSNSDGRSSRTNYGNEDRRFQDQSDEMNVTDLGMMTGFEFWGEVPYRPADGARNRVITILNGVHVRSHINPYLDGNIPFKEIVLNPVSGRFYGLSPAEVFRFLQDSADNMLMLLNDAADMSVHGSLLMGASFGGDPNRVKARRLGDVIPCSNPEAIQPLPFDVNTITIAAAEYLRRKQEIMGSSGANSPLETLGNLDRSAATTTNEIVRLATQRVDLMVQLVERDDYPWIGRTIHSRMRQFLSPESEQILAGERFPVTLDDVDFDADIRFVGSRQAGTKFQRAASKREALNILGTNPGIIIPFQDLIVRYLRDDLDIPDAQMIVGKAVAYFEQQQLQQQAMAMQEQNAQQTGNPVGSTEQDFGSAVGETEREGVPLA